MESWNVEGGPEQSPDRARGSDRGDDTKGGVRRNRRAGPKTPQGKARVRLNAVRHGVTATVPVIPGVERVEDWKAHRAGVVQSLAPVDYLETELARRVALQLWRLRRVAVYERAAIAEEKVEAEDELLELPDLRRKGRDLFRGKHLLPGCEMDRIVRYEAHVSRQLYQAMHELEALQIRRRGQPAPLARLDVHGPPETD